MSLNHKLAAMAAVLIVGSSSALLAQTQQTTLELERLLTQLRGNWLLGGGGEVEPAGTRLPALEARP